MNKIKVALIITMLFSVMFFAGCTEEDPNSIEAKKFVGIWEDSGNSASYVFYEKGAFRFDSMDDGRFEGTYKINNELLLFTYTFPSDYEGTVQSFNYSFSNNDETFTISPYGYPEYSKVFYKH